MHGDVAERADDYKIILFVISAQADLARIVLFLWDCPCCCPSCWIFLPFFHVLNVFHILFGECADKTQGIVFFKVELFSRKVILLDVRQGVFGYAFLKKIDDVI
jgi:hypothetical protein